MISLFRNVYNLARRTSVLENTSFKIGGQ